MEIDHAFYTDDSGNTYYDYKLYFTSYDRYRSRSTKTPNCCLDFKTRNLIGDSKKIKTLLHYTANPPKGSSIYISPNCKYSSADVRKNYNIKRNVDSGDYNVFCPINVDSYINKITCRRVVIFPSRRVIVATDAGSDQDALNAAFSYDTSLMRCESEVFYNCSFYTYNIAESYLDLLKGNLTKTCVPQDNLDMNSDNELTVDVLMLAYQAAKRSYLEKDAKENFETQMHMLNQHNWREYPGAITIFNKMLQLGNVGYAVYRECYRHKSSLSKPEKEIMLHPYEGFSSEKDFLLAQDFVCSILNIQDTKFVTFESCVQKLVDEKTPFNVFYALFDAAVKVSLKKYVEI